MSKLSIYETNWINLVFENRNKEYGAYQLRQESAKTSLYALFIGLLLASSLMSIPKILSYFHVEKNILTVPTIPFDQIIEVTNIFQEEIIKPKQQIQPPLIEQKVIETIEKDQLINPTIVQASLATADIATNEENALINKPLSDGLGVIGTNTIPSQGTATEIVNPKDYGNTVVTNAILDKLPEFPGGINKFYTYIGKNFETPEIAGGKNIRIYVSFVVEKDGSMTDIQVKNNPGYGLEKEAIRVLKSMKTKWSPGMMDSKPVRTSYNLPITVQIN